MITDRLYNLRIWVRLLFSIWLMLVIAWSGTIGWSVYQQRAVAVEQAADFTATMNEMTMAGLTAMMITGTMQHRREFLDQIQELGNVRDVRVLRGPATEQIYGPGHEDEQPRDDIERGVLETGEPYVRVTDGGGELRAVIPNFNERDYLGKNCVMCHGEPLEGEVLGAVAMRISLEDVNQAVMGFGMTVFGIAVLISGPLLFAVYLFIRTFVTAPLRGVTASLEEIAGGGGDLTRRLPVRGHDEVGQLSTAFNQTMETFHDLIRRVVTSAERILGAAERVSQVTDQTDQRIRHQREQIEQVAAAMNEMTATAQDVARNAQHAADASRAGEAAAGQGREVVHATVNGIEQLAADVRRAAEAIRKLVDDSERIGTVIDLIREITEQTNLLSLNAAIEAARAGDQGRGFAVVADEVRKLATRTHQSTEQIQEMIGQIQRETTGAEGAMEQGYTQAQKTVEMASDTGRALGDIEQAVDRINQVATEIASAAEEQSQVANEINQGVTAINDISTETARASQQTKEAGDELEQLAREMKRLVEQFKV